MMTLIVRIFFVFLLIILSNVSLAVFQEAEVIDLSQENYFAEEKKGLKNGREEPLPMVLETVKNKVSEAKLRSDEVNASDLFEQRLSRLEQQIENLIEMNSLSRIELLQQEVQKLTGLYEQQSYDVKALKDQLRAFYKDLAERINATRAIATESLSQQKDLTGSSLDSASSTLPSATAAISSGNDVAIPEEQKEYEEAFDLLGEKKYYSASLKLRSYLKNYPDGIYALNARYWLAECFYLLGRFHEALREFKVVVNKYPSSNKIPDSLLKLGLVYDKLGKKEEARKKLLEVTKRFPGSSAAKLAERQLAQLL